jgi:hypothetical protein
MNCDEVIDLIQRDLDETILEEEHRQVAAHTASCQACAKMQARLHHLNLGLMNLPNVAPAYSLVDAILPELEKLDAAKGHQKMNRMVQGWFNKKRLFTTSGALGAAVVLGLLIVNGLPEPMNQSVQPLASESKALDAVQQSVRVEPPSPVTSATTESSSASESPSTTGKKSVVVEQSPESRTANTSAPQANEVKEMSKAESSANVAVPKMSTSQETDESNSIQVKSARSGIMASAPVESTPVLVSTDGTLTASLRMTDSDSQTVQVTNTDGEIVFESIHNWRTDVYIQLQSWENNKFTYSVMLTDGTSRTFEVNMATKMENEIYK